jgi:DNA-binding SARP family transcriptional activator
MTAITGHQRRLFAASSGRETSTGKPTQSTRRAHAEVMLLGGFRLSLGGRDVRLPVGAQRLVALLSLSGQVGRSRLAGTLWPDTTEQRALASLRTGIWRINQAVPDLVITMAGQVDLDTCAQVDVRVLIRWATEILQGGELTALPMATGIPEGELLPDWDDTWLVAERERLHQMRLHVLEMVADQFADRGRFGLALEVALSVLRVDALRESAHRTVVRIHLAEGNLNEAHRAYIACEQLLNRELGVTPTIAMTSLLSRFPAQRGDSLQLDRIAPHENSACSTM